jgi:hypothetical protein
MISFGWSNLSDSLAMKSIRGNEAQRSHRDRVRVQIMASDLGLEIKKILM